MSRVRFKQFALVCILLTGCGSDGDAPTVRNRSMRPAPAESTRTSQITEFESCVSELAAESIESRQIDPLRPFPQKASRVRVERAADLVLTREASAEVQGAIRSCESRYEIAGSFPLPQASEIDRRSTIQSDVTISEISVVDGEETLGILGGSGTDQSPYVVESHLTGRHYFRFSWESDEADFTGMNIGDWAEVLKVGGNDLPKTPFMQCYGGAKSESGDSYSIRCGIYASYAHSAFLTPGDYLLRFAKYDQSTALPYSPIITPSNCEECETLTTWLRVVEPPTPIITPKTFGSFQGNGSEASPFQVPASAMTSGMSHDLTWSVWDPSQVVAQLGSDYSTHLLGLKDGFIWPTGISLDCDPSSISGSTGFHGDCTISSLSVQPGLYLGVFPPKGPTFVEALYNGLLGVTTIPEAQAWFEVLGPGYDLSEIAAPHQLISAVTYGDLQGAGTLADPFILPPDKANWDWPRTITWEVQDAGDVIGGVSTTSAVYTLNEFGLHLRFGRMVECDQKKYSDKNPPAVGSHSNSGCKLFIDEGFHLVTFGLMSNEYNVALGDGFTDPIESARFWIFVG